eukprot:7202627-Pyramimonas_sp.AAC.3
MLARSRAREGTRALWRDAEATEAESHCGPWQLTTRTYQDASVRLIEIGRMQIVEPLLPSGVPYVCSKKRTGTGNAGHGTDTHRG